MGSAQELLGIEVVERDDAGAGQDGVERRHVVLEVEDGDVERGELAAHELPQREETQPAAVVEGLELRCEVAPDASKIVSDRELLLMILQNLVGNAIKYSKQGAVRIVAAKQGQGCRLSVVDEGPGIDEQQLAKMFQPFARGETHGQAGTGLGLSIARQAADLLGAKLWAESQLGRGSAFHLDLPPQPPAKSA